MRTNTTRELFEQIKQLLPGLPENVTHLELILGVNSVPMVICKFQVKEAGTISENQRTFLIKDSNP